MTTMAYGEEPAYTNAHGHEKTKCIKGSASIFFFRWNM